MSSQDSNWAKLGRGGASGSLGDHPRPLSGPSWSRFGAKFGVGAVSAAKPSFPPVPAIGGTVSAKLGTKPPFLPSLREFASVDAGTGRKEACGCRPPWLLLLLPSAPRALPHASFPGAWLGAAAAPAPAATPTIMPMRRGLTGCLAPPGDPPALAPPRGGRGKPARAHERHTRPRRPDSSG